MNGAGAGSPADFLASASLSVVCLGSSSVVASATSENSALSSVCLMESGRPVLLIGVGSGVLRSCLERLPSLPEAIFLPSMRICCAADLQAYLLLAAERRIHVKVFAASEVIDRVVDTLLDVECSEVIGEFSEFLEVSPNVPTEIRTAVASLADDGEPDPLNILMKECASSISDEDMSSAIGSSESRGYNLIVLFNEVPVVGVLEGPTHVEQLDDFALSVRSASAVAVRRWRKCSDTQLRGFLDLSSQSIFLLQGYDSGRKQQAIAGCVDLQAGDAVVGDGDGEDVRDMAWVLVPQAAPRKLVTKGAKKKAAPQRPAWNEDTSSPTTHGVRSPRQTSDGIVESPDELNPERSRLRELGTATGGILSSTSPRSALKRAPPAWLDRWIKQHSGRFEEEDGFTYTGKVPEYQHRGDMFGLPPAPPKKVFFFNFDEKLAPPVSLVISQSWSLEVIKRKVSAALNLRPLGQLVSLETGYVRSPTELVHMQQIVVLRHGGKPFSIYELPVTMSLPPIDDEDDMLPA